MSDTFFGGGGSGGQRFSPKGHGLRKSMNDCDTFASLFLPIPISTQ